jgi:SP family arabinose:H+ symporter-like MFS transporter
MLVDISSKKAGYGKYPYFIAFTAAMGGFLFGYDLAVMSGANIFLREQYHLTDAGFAFTTMSALLGCVLGPFLGGWLCDRFGREKTLFIAGIFLAVSAILTAIAWNMTIFNIFRIIGGVGVGLCSIAAPMYIAEAAPAKIRGTLGVMYTIVIGSVAAAFVTWWLAAVMSEQISWRYMFGSEMVPIILFMAFLLRLPPSPRWLAAKGQIDQAREVLIRIGGPQQADQELSSICLSLSEEQGGWREMLDPKIIKMLGIALLLVIYNGWTGWGSVAGYLPALMQKLGIEIKADAILVFAIVYGFMAAMTVVSMYLVDRVGRRPLWMTASLIMMVAMFLLGLVYQLQLSWVVGLGIFCLVALPHALGFAPLPWLMMSELFPTRIRARCVALMTTILWIFMFGSGFVFPILEDLSERLMGTIAGAMWIFTIINLTALLFGWKWLPETKGITLENILSKAKK